MAYLGIDIGGTGAKAGVYDLAGNRLASAHRAYSPDANDEGRAEIAMPIIEAAVREAVREAVANSESSIRALSVVSQGQTFVSLDASGAPVHPAILWYDSRARLQAESLARIRAARPGPRPEIEAISSAPKILWLREHHPEAMERARHHLLLPDYMTFRLMGRAVTDPHTAASTGLTTGGESYDAAALEAAGISRSSLADILPPGYAAGTVTPRAAAEWGLSENTLVVAGTNDQYAGAMGAGLYRPGLLSVATGTCLALVALTQKKPDSLPGGVWGGDFPIPGLFFILAYSKTAGVALEWFQRVLAPDRSMRELDAEAASVPIGSRGVVACPHFDGQVSPAPDASMRGLFGGLSLHHTRADLYRSLVESLAFSLRENVDHIRAQGCQVEQIRAIGGAAKSDFWLQMQADVTGLEVQRPRITEAATLGAAMLAAKGAGDFASLVSSVEQLYKPGRTFTPIPSHSVQYDAPFLRYRNVLPKSRPSS
jgi:xylulokinase